MVGRRGPLVDRIEYSSPPPYDILVPDHSDDELDPAQRAAKRRRIEQHGNDYLKGKDIFISSAVLRGVFDTKCPNPWRKYRGIASVANSEAGSELGIDEKRAGINRVEVEEAGSQAESLEHVLDDNVRDKLTKKPTTTLREAHNLDNIRHERSNSKASAGYCNEWLQRQNTHSPTVDSDDDEPLRKRFLTPSKPPQGRATSRKFAQISHPPGIHHRSQRKEEPLVQSRGSANGQALAPLTVVHESIVATLGSSTLHGLPLTESLSQGNVGPSSEHQNEAAKPAEQTVALPPSRILPERASPRSQHQSGFTPIKSPLRTNAHPMQLPDQEGVIQASRRAHEVLLSTERTDRLADTPRVRTVSLHLKGPVTALQSSRHPLVASPAVPNGSPGFAYRRLSDGSRPPAPLPVLKTNHTKTKNKGRHNTVAHLNLQLDLEDNTPMDDQEPAVVASDPPQDIDSADSEIMNNAGSEVQILRPNSYGKWICPVQSNAKGSTPWSTKNLPCNKVFSSRKGLRQHIARGHKLLPFQKNGQKWVAVEERILLHNDLHRPNVCKELSTTTASRQVESFEPAALLKRHPKVAKQLKTAEQHNAAKQPKVAKQPQRVKQPKIAKAARQGKTSVARPTLELVSSSVARPTMDFKSTSATTEGSRLSYAPQQPEEDHEMQDAVETHQEIAQPEPGSALEELNTSHRTERSPEASGQAEGPLINAESNDTIQNDSEKTRPSPSAVAMQTTKEHAATNVEQSAVSGDMPADESTSTKDKTSTIETGPTIPDRQDSRAYSIFTFNPEMSTQAALIQAQLAFQDTQVDERDSDLDEVNADPAPHAPALGTLISKSINNLGAVTPFRELNSRSAAPAPPLFPLEPASTQDLAAAAADLTFSTVKKPFSTKQISFADWPVSKPSKGGRGILKKPSFKGWSPSKEMDTPLPKNPFSGTGTTPETGAVEWNNGLGGEEGEMGRSSQMRGHPSFSVGLGRMMPSRTSSAQHTQSSNPAPRNTIFPISTSQNHSLSFSARQIPVGSGYPTSSAFLASSALSRTSSPSAPSDLPVPSFQEGQGVGPGVRMRGMGQGIRMESVESRDLERMLDEADEFLGSWNVDARSKDGKSSSFTAA